MAKAKSSLRPNPRTKNTLLRFDGVARPVLVADGGEILECLRAVLTSWGFDELGPRAMRAPFITVRHRKGRYEILSPYRAPIRYRDAVNAVCTLISDLIRAYIDEDEALICLHAAAAEFAGRLVILPNTYRTGKSTFAAYLAAAGVRLYGDDVVPIRWRDHVALAPGIAPRLRLPLPDDASPKVKSYIKRARGPESSRYLYLDLSGAALAGRGEQSPIGAFVLLQRRLGAKAELHPMGASEMLARLVSRNFANRVEASDILDCLHDMVAEVPCHTLRYGHAAEAVELLKQHFASWPQQGRPLPKTATAPTTPLPIGEDISVSGRFMQNLNVLEKPVEDELFLVEPNSNAIYKLNTVGAALWRLLSRPMTAHEATTFICRAYPDMPPSVISRDVGVVLAELETKGLVVPDR